MMVTVLYIGNGLMKEGKFNDAIDMYSQSITLDSTNATYFANRYPIPVIPVLLLYCIGI